MDGVSDGGCIKIEELLPAAVLGAGSGSQKINTASVGERVATTSKSSANKKPVRKRAAGEGKAASKKRARTQSESDVDLGENLHPRPKMSYAQLAALALRATEKNEATVGEIYKWIQDNYPYYKHGAPWWKNCIRHNLSMKSCFMRTETEQRAFWSLDYEQADQIFNAEKRSSATWQQMTGSRGISAAVSSGALPKSASAKPRLAKGHGASSASLSAAASRKAAKIAAGIAKEMKAPKKARESKPKKGFKNMGTQTLQSSKSTQTDITLATMATLGLPDITHAPGLGTAFVGGGSSSRRSKMAANIEPRPVVLRTPRGAFSTSFDMLQRPDLGLGMSLQGATYPGDLEVGLDEVDSVNRLLDDVSYGGDDNDDGDGDGGGFNMDPLAQSWGGFPTNWKDQKGSFESLF